MKDLLAGVDSPLFHGIAPADRKAVLGCVGYHVGSFAKGELVALEEENLKHTGGILSLCRGELEKMKDEGLIGYDKNCFRML